MMSFFATLFGKKNAGPRLTMVSNLQRCKRSDAKLRTMLYRLSTPHCEEAFTYSGFPYDDGRRAYLPHEADDKLAYHVDRLFETAGTSLHWVNNCTDVVKFFAHWDEYVDAMQKLVQFEEYVIFRAPVPSRTLRRFCENEDDIQCAMIDRVWASTIREAQNLKTEAAQNRRIDDMVGVIHSQRERISPKAEQKLKRLLSELRAASPDNSSPVTPVMKIQVKEKPMPVFDASKEASLCAEYRNAKSAIDKHFARQALISFYYKYRQDGKYAALCEKYCQEDITILDELDRAARKAAWTKEEERRGFLGRIVAFEKLIMLHQSRGDYKEALAWCDRAIAHNQAHGTDVENYQVKRDRILKKLNSSK